MIKPWEVWYRTSVSWTPLEQDLDQDLPRWWAFVHQATEPIRLVINDAVHRRLQNMPMVWPKNVQRVDTLLSPTTSPEGLRAWQNAPSSWGWLWCSPLRKDVRLPSPLDWPACPSFKAEIVANGGDDWPSAHAWWLRWVSDPTRADIAVEVWLDERQGLTKDVLQAWDLWQTKVARLALRQQWPVKPWVGDAFDAQDPRWNPLNHRRWGPDGTVPHAPPWLAAHVMPDLVAAPCATCLAHTSCPGPSLPERWSTLEGVCSMGRTWRASALNGVFP